MKHIRNVNKGAALWSLQDLTLPRLGARSLRIWASFGLMKNPPDSLLGPIHSPAPFLSVFLPSLAPAGIKDARKVMDKQFKVKGGKMILFMNPRVPG